jgi:hypothetical protein
MLAFAHIPTGTTTDNEFANDEVNGKLVETATRSPIPERDFCHVQNSAQQLSRRA